MSEKGTLRNCVLLKAQTHAPAAAAAQSHIEQPAVFEVCCKCGCDVEGDTQDKDGRPICMACLEAKDRKGLGMGGWFKNLRGTEQCDTPAVLPILRPQQLTLCRRRRGFGRKQGVEG
jgi:hypothetical protein